MHILKFLEEETESIDIEAGEEDPPKLNIHFQIHIHQGQDQGGEVDQDEEKGDEIIFDLFAQQAPQ